MYIHSWLGMTGTFYALLWYHGGGMNTDMSQHRKVMEFLVLGLNPEPFSYRPGALWLSYSCPGVCMCGCGCMFVCVKALMQYICLTSMRGEAGCIVCMLWLYCSLQLLKETSNKRERESGRSHSSFASFESALVPTCLCLPCLYVYSMRQDHHNQLSLPFSMRRPA